MKRPSKPKDWCCTVRAGEAITEENQDIEGLTSPTGRQMESDLPIDLAMPARIIGA